MNTYKITLHSGPTFTAEDKRDLQKLSADLCSAGFIVLHRTSPGYSAEKKPISVLERAVASIEPAS
jgi:hypothetical protein